MKSQTALEYAVMGKALEVQRAVQVVFDRYYFGYLIDSLNYYHDSLIHLPLLRQDPAFRTPNSLIVGERMDSV
jgi:hypothetical protein